MDKVLIMDGMNAIHRANISFGPPRKHDTCLNQFCSHKLLNEHVIHCLCGARWDNENKCYGKKFTLIFNFFRNLRPLIEDGNPDKFYFVLEGRPQFRYDLFPDYKANRIIKQASKQEAMDKINLDKNEIIRLLQYLPVTIIRAANYEADDVISTLVENMKDEDITVISNDSDYIQLLQKGYKHLTIFNPIKKEVMEAPIYPYIAWKALNGDKSDSIPGILKPAKALKTINDPELFEKFMEINENKCNFNINRQLIEFRSVPEDDLIIKDCVANFELLKQEFIKMDFQSIVNEDSWNKYVNTFKYIKL